MVNRGGLYARYFGKKDVMFANVTDKPTFDIKVTVTPVTETLREAVTKIEASRKVGRPKKADALTAAQRQQKRRAKLKGKTDAEWLAETVGADG